MIGVYLLLQYYSHWNSSYIESVDSICRDGVDMEYMIMQKISKISKAVN